MTHALPPAVVLGLSATGLHVIRSLGRAGVPVYALGEAAHAGAGSRYVRERFVDPDPVARMAWLRDRFRGDGPPVVLIPCSDQDVDLVMDHAPELGPRFRIAASYRNGLARQIMDKDQFYRLCADHGVDYPRVEDGSVADLQARAEDLTYPAFVKPARVQDCKRLLKGRKGWVVRDAPGLRRLLDQMPHLGTFLVQRIVEGPESEITLYSGYFGADGTARQGFTARKLRQFPPGFGSASMVQSADDTETRSLAEGFLHALGFQGIAAAEFKRDPKTGRLTMIEVNVRPSLWFGVGPAAARPTVLSAYHDLAETGIELTEEPQRQGVRWHYGAKDAWSAAFYACQRDFILPAPDVSAVGPAQDHVRAVFARDDWRPALSEAWALAHKALARFPRFRHAG